MPDWPSLVLKPLLDGVPVDLLDVLDVPESYAAQQEVVLEVLAIDIGGLVMLLVRGSKYACCLSLR